MAVMVQVDGKNFNNVNFVLIPGMKQHKLT